MKKRDKIKGIEPLATSLTKIETVELLSDTAIVSIVGLIYKAYKLGRRKRGKETKPDIPFLFFMEYEKLPLDQAKLEWKKMSHMIKASYAQEAEETNWKPKKKSTFNLNSAINSRIGHSHKNKKK